MENNLKTRQRQLMLELIQESKGHVNAKELFKRAIEKDTSISQATVYRSLNLFKQLGLIEEKHLGQPQCYYEVKHEPEHQHLVCQICGKVIDFTCPMSELLEKVKSEHGFIVTRAEVYLEGYCSECEVDKNDKNNRYS